MGVKRRGCRRSLGAFLPLYLTLDNLSLPVAFSPLVSLLMVDALPPLPTPPFRPSLLRRLHPSGASPPKKPPSSPIAFLQPKPPPPAVANSSTRTTSLGSESKLLRRRWRRGRGDRASEMLSGRISTSSSFLHSSIFSTPLPSFLPFSRLSRLTNRPLSVPSTTAPPTATALLLPPTFPQSRPSPSSLPQKPLESPPGRKPSPPPTSPSRSFRSRRKTMKIASRNSEGGAAGGEWRGRGAR